MMSQFNNWNGTLKLPELIEIEVTNTCNLRCRMCHVSFEPSLPTQLFDVELVDKLHCLQGSYVVLGSGFEPMLHPHFSKLVRQLSTLDMTIEIVTNATQCNGDKLNALIDARTHLINLSFDGGTPETYNYIRRQSNYDRVIGNIENLKNRFVNKDTFFAVNNTVMKSNLSEVITAVDLWESLEIDMMRILPMTVRFPDISLIKESLYPINCKVQEVLDDASRHIIENQLRIALWRSYQDRSPLKKEYPKNFVGQWICSDRPDVRVLENCREFYLNKKHPMMPSYKCGSAFNFARILPNGDIQLCYKYSVGNLFNASFEDIWFGEEANRIRKKIVETEKDCTECDYFRFGIGLEELDMYQLESHFNHSLSPFLNSVDFLNGTIDVNVSAPPRLISSEGNHNIVYFKESFFGVPHNVGPIELDKVDLSSIPDIILGDAYAEVLSRVRQKNQISS